MAKAEVSEFDGIDDEDIDNFEDRLPRLGLGSYLVEIQSTKMKKSFEKQVKYLDVSVQVIESDNPEHQAGQDACVQIWFSKFPKYALSKIRKLIIATGVPEKSVTPKFCDESIGEDLLGGKRFRVTVENNAAGYPDNEYAPE